MKVWTTEAQHHCGPNDHGFWLGHEHETRGTVLACPECGQTWVSMGDAAANVFLVVWRREGRVARWLRERRPDR